MVVVVKRGEVKRAHAVSQHRTDTLYFTWEPAHLVQGGTLSVCLKYNYWKPGGLGTARRTFTKMENEYNFSADLFLG